MRYFIPKTGVKAIDTAIEALFNRMKLRFLGKNFEPKQIRFSVKPDKAVDYREDLSLPSIFDKAAASEGMKPNQPLKQSVTGIIEQYLDAHQEAAKAKVKAAVQSALSEAEMAGEEVDVNKVLKEQLSDVMDGVTTGVKTVVDNEMGRAKNLSTLDAITKISAFSNISDPTVVFIGPNDQHTCKDCQRLFYLEDGITPRVWKMSELKAGYGRHGATCPCMGIQHPHCFTGNMRLYCDKGMIPISELVGQGKLLLTVDNRIRGRLTTGNQHQKVVKGSIMLDRHGLGARSLESTDLGVYSTGDRPCVRITLKNGNNIEVSKDHEMWVDDNKQGIKVPASDIKVGDKIPIISGETLFGNDHFPIEAELMGNLMGDGYIDEETGTAHWNFFGNDIPYGNELLKIACMLPEGADLAEKHSRTGMFLKEEAENNIYNCKQATFNSGKLGRFFIKEFGFSKQPRRVPTRLWRADKETVAAFIRGLMAADGNVNRECALVLSQNDRELLQEIQLLLNGFGINSYLCKHGDTETKTFKRKDGTERVVIFKPCWRLIFGGRRNVGIFQKDIGFGIPIKNERMADRLKKDADKKGPGSWRTSIVISVEDIGVQPTFCVTEPTTNTVTVNGIVTGQCRHALSPMMPGFGFGPDGRITYIDPGFDVHKDQHKG